MKTIKSISCKLVLVMTMLCCFTGYFTPLAQAASHQPNAVSLVSFISTLEGKFDVRFSYRTNLVKDKMVEHPALAEFNAGNIDAKLNEYLQPLGLLCKRINNKLYIIANDQPATKKADAPFWQAPAALVKGTVKDTVGRTLPGVAVRVKGTSRGAITDGNGQFSLDGVNNGDVLVFSLIGYQPLEVTFAGQANLSIALHESSIALDQVVVTALGIKRQEKALGYAVQRVTGNAVQTVKGVDMATSLTGQVSGLVIKNSTEFFAAPTLELRGEEALLVIDGVPYGNMTLRDVPSDDIQSIDVLKGPTASALYGSRASGGVILITTKRGMGEGGLSVNINSNTMFQTGFLAIPEVQTNYGRGQNGKIDNDYVWGPRLGIGQTATDWNPVTKQFEANRPLNSVGGNNLKNFMELGVITNNNINVTQTGKNGSFRASMNHIYNKGQFPNAKMNIYNFTVGGDIKAGDKFTLEAHMGISRKEAPQTWGSGYGNQGYIYQLTMWTGPEYDIRDYKDYWKVKDQTQNWMYTNWYDNPYLIAYEKLYGVKNNTFNASMTANYKFSKDLNLLVRMGYDAFQNRETMSNPTANIFSTRGGWNARGYYALSNFDGYSMNNDVLLTYSKKVKDFTFDAMAGGTIYLRRSDSLIAATRNGLISPRFFSLAGSIEAPTFTQGTGRQQINSLYGKASIGWRNRVFIDATGRNDWNSTQPEDSRAYFYPSIGSSVVMSEFFKMPQFVDMWKFRGSWATFKTPAKVYQINRLYTTTIAAWNNMNSATYPSNLLGADLLPSSMRTWEIGTAAYLFNKRINVDVAYFNKYYYNQQTVVNIPESSGYSSTLINTGETYVRKGVEITVGASVVKKKNFEWNTILNWSNQHRYYKDLDSLYSSKNPWVRSGERMDAYTARYFLRDPQGNVIHNNGLPMTSDYNKVYGFTDPKFSFGFINTFLIHQHFTVTLNVDGRIGGVMYNYVDDKMYDTGTHPATDNNWRYDEVVKGLKNYVGNGVKVVSGSVRYDNFGNIVYDDRKYEKNDVAASYQAYTQRFHAGDYGVQKKSFVKVREVSIGYNIPKKVFGNSGIKNASVAVSAQNLFLFTKFKYSDPDVDTENLNSPSQRMIGVNFKVGF
ncbi:TonB-linked SusC/RagA family outer membrane protein [Chitinophaga skermanii]|uniref:TonB-linked SusC/RagA family outer membrane protein n=1 Tax=Chitinophaga skermanii TaxID=331697 RepID=A0A327R674_9BACT|nr:SusC/RagA family TonB-linked outer membrane protein [Chitinophaga skermanii]RAJ11194.1 TonB-linked SusC/RagA family outer membrane protein [Chitinophaga skermanii]